MTKELNAIIEAYEGILSEGKEAKFKVGDKVGIGNDNGWGVYHGNDTGTVTKVNGHGHHTVVFDKRKSADDHTTPYTEVFDHEGKSKKQYSAQKLVSLDQHNKDETDRKNQIERNADLTAIGRHIEGLRNGFGNHSKITKAHSEFLKSLIDKHTEEK
jgi:hypothetical protein